MDDSVHSISLAGNWRGCVIDGLSGIGFLDSGEGLAVVGEVGVELAVLTLRTVCGLCVCECVCSVVEEVCRCLLSLVRRGLV